MGALATLDERLQRLLFYSSFDTNSNDLVTFSLTNGIICGDRPALRLSIRGNMPAGIDRSRESFAHKTMWYCEHNRLRCFVAMESILAFPYVQN
jgi:hypothetical protein